MTIQYSLVISIEKIISLYIQKYRFEQYENNQDKYHEKLVLQRKSGEAEGSVRLCLLSGKSTGANAMAPTSFEMHRVNPGVGRPTHGGNVRWARMGSLVRQTTQINFFLTAFTLEFPC